LQFLSGVAVAGSGDTAPVPKPGQPGSDRRSIGTVEGSDVINLVLLKPCGLSGGDGFADDDMQAALGAAEKRAQKAKMHLFVHYSECMVKDEWVTPLLSHLWG